MKQILSLLGLTKASRMRKAIQRKEKEALKTQRNGDLRTYASLMVEIDTMYTELENLPA